MQAKGFEVADLKIANMDLSLVSCGDDIKIWDCANFVQMKQFNPHDQNINSVCWSPDNSFLASSSIYTDEVRLTYVKDYESFSLPTSGGCMCVDVHDTSRYILNAGSDGLISVWDLKDKRKKKTYKGHKGPVTSAKFNKGSNYIASGSETGEIILHNVVTGHGCQPLTAPNIQAIKQVQYSHCKKSLLGSVSDDGCVNLWDCNKQQLVQTFRCHQAPATGLSFSPINDIFLMSVGLDKRIACHDLQRKEVVKMMNAESPLTSIDTKSDGITVAVGSIRGKIYQYDLRMNSVPVKTIEAHRSSVQCLQFQKEPSETSFNKPVTATGKQQLKNRRLPVSPKSSSNTTEVIGTSSMESKHSGQPVVDDMFSPMKEGHQDQSAELETDYHASGSFTKNPSNQSKNSTGDGYKGGMFSPINENIGLGSSSLGVSPLAMSGYPSDHRNSPGYADYTRLENQGVSTVAVNERQKLEDNKQSHSKQQNNNSQQKQVTFMSGDTDPYAFLVSGSSSSSSDTTSPEVKRPRSAYQHQVGISASPSLPSTADSQGSVVASSCSSVRHFKATTPDGVNAQSSIVNSFDQYENGPVRHSQTVPTDMKQFAQVIRTVVQEELDSFKRNIRNVVRDEVDDMVDQLHKDIINLQAEMLRQFQIHQSEMMSLLEHYSVNKDMAAEVERLQEEVKRLKRNF